MWHFLDLFKGHSHPAFGFSRSLTVLPSHCNCGMFLRVTWRVDFTGDLAELEDFHKKMEGFWVFSVGIGPKSWVDSRNYHGFIMDLSWIYLLNRQKYPKVGWIRMDLSIESSVSPDVH